MNVAVQLPPEQQRLLGRAVKLATEGRHESVAESHPELRDPALVRALCDEATRLLRVDVGQAGRVAELAARLADRIEDVALRARSLRARANVQHVRGELKSALRLYEQAIDLFTNLELDLEASITRSSALQTLVYLGQHDRSLEWAERARTTFTCAGDEVRLGRLDLNLGTIVYRQERFEEARELMERAYERLLTVGDPADVAHCLRNLATVHISLKNFREAEDVYARARTYCERERLPLLLGEVEYNIAYLYYLRGEYPTALELYRKTRERCEATGEVYHRALCDLDEAEIYLELNLIDETLRSTDAAYRAFEQLGLRYESAKSLAYLAIARIRQGKTILGLDLFDRAREIFVDEHNDVWAGLIDLLKASALAREGRRFEAEMLAAEAHAVFSTIGLTTKVAACEILRASLRLQDGDAAGARRLCLRALERLQTLELPSLEHAALYTLGRIEESDGDPEAALAAFEASHEKLVRTRTSTQADELKIPFLERKLQVYESLVKLRVEGWTAPDPEAVLGYIELAKSRNLVDLLASRGLALPTRQARSVQVERVRRLREELNWYYRRLDLREMALQDPSAEDLTTLLDQTRATEAALADCLREVELADPEFASLHTASAASAEQIVESLPSGTTLIELYTAHDTIYACTLDARGIEVEPVTLASRVHAIHRRFGDQLLKFRLGTAHVERYSDGIRHASEELLQELYRELFEPLEPRLEGSDHLIVVPDGPLHWLPFSALHDGSGYLVDRFAISYAPTATVLERCRRRPEVEARDTLLMAAGDDAAPEARAVARLLGAERVLLGSRATGAALREFGRGARVIHLNAAAEYRSDNPMFSSLRLGDGGVSLFELYALDLDSELVVLSGCGRSSEAPSDGDDWLGLARGLLYAGARSLLLPLWNPPAESRMELLTSFYRSLGEAPDRTRALRQAMLEVKRRHDHPFYWASFALIGDPGPMSG